MRGMMIGATFVVLMSLGILAGIGIAQVQLCDRQCLSQNCNGQPVRRFDGSLDGCRESHIPFSKACTGDCKLCINGSTDFHCEDVKAKTCTGTGAAPAFACGTEYVIANGCRGSYYPDCKCPTGGGTTTTTPCMLWACVAGN